MPPVAKARSAPKDSSTATIGFEAKLWLTADKLRNNMDAAEYSRAERDRLPQAARRVGAEAPINHVVLGLIFLKYISDTFEEHRVGVRMKAEGGMMKAALPIPTSSFSLRTWPDAMVAIERDLEMSNAEARRWN